MASMQSRRGDETGIGGPPRASRQAASSLAYQVLSAPRRVLGSAGADSSRGGASASASASASSRSIISRGRRSVAPRSAARGFAWSSSANPPATQGSATAQGSHARAVLDLYCGKCRVLADRLTDAHTEMMAALEQLRLYQKQQLQEHYQQSQGQLQYRSAVLPMGSRSPSKPGCYTCLQEVVSLLLKMLTSLHLFAPTVNCLMKADILSQLLHCNMRLGGSAAREAARHTIIVIAQSSPEATDMVAQNLEQLHSLHLLHRHGCHLRAISDDLQLLQDLCTMQSVKGKQVENNTAAVQCWTRFMKMLKDLLVRAAELGNTSREVTDEVALPCLNTLALVCAEHEQYPTDVLEELWSDVIKATDAAWCASSPWQTARQTRCARLARKVIGKWRKGRAVASAGAVASVSPADFSTKWNPLLQLWVNPFSSQVRKAAGLVLSRLLPGAPSERVEQVGDLAAYTLGCGATAGLEKELDQVLILFTKACGDTEHNMRGYMAARGLLSFVASLIQREANWMQQQESFVTLHSFSEARSIRSGGLLLPLVEAMTDLVEHSAVVAEKFNSAHLDVALEALVKLRGLEIIRGEAITKAVAKLEQVMIQGGKLQQRRYVSAAVRVLLRSAISPDPKQLHHHHHHHHHGVVLVLPPASVKSLLQEVQNIVVPPTALPGFLVLLKRAPSQEEFFRGNLPTNPIQATSILDASSAAAASGSSPAEPTMRDLRHRIAMDLDMVDATELLELLVCNKIVNLDLAVRVVQHELWRPHVLDNEGEEYESDCEAEALPPMLVTYRLAGVDGEATEEVLDSLSDSAAAEGQDPEQQFEVCKVIADEGGLPLLLSLAQPPSEGSNNADRWSAFLCAVSLLRSCCMLSCNRSRLLLLRAPGILLHRLLDVLRSTKEYPQSIVDDTLFMMEKLMHDASEVTEADDEAIDADDDSDVSQEEEDSSRHLSFLFSALEEPLVIAVLRETPSLSQALSRLLPFLTYGRAEPATALAAMFQRVLTWEEMGGSAPEEETEESSSGVRRQCFVNAAEIIAADRVGNVVRDCLHRSGFVEQTAQFALEGAPEVVNASAEADMWSSYFSKPALPKALRVLTGMCKGHAQSQNVLQACGLLPVLHQMESMASSGEVGLLAETLLESIALNNDKTTAEIQSLRDGSRAAKRLKAQQQREKALKALGQTKGKGKAKASSTAMMSWMDEMENMEEEAGLTCMVCQEGYSCRPTDVLGLYLHAKLVPGSDLALLEGDALLAASNSKSAKDKATPSPSPARRFRSLFSSTSAFNIIHISCHDKASKAERGLRTPKSEWEGAALRNSRVQCNTVLPLRGAATPKEAYRSSLDKHFTMLQEVGHSSASRLSVVLHDVRMLLLQFSYGEDVSAHSGGGSLTSNMLLMAYQLQTAAHLMVNGPPSVVASVNDQHTRLLHAFVAGTAEEAMHDCACYLMVASILYWNKTEWAKHRELFVKQCVIHAGAQKGRGEEGSGLEDRRRTRSRSISSVGGSPSIRGKRKRQTSFSSLDLSAEAKEDSNASEIHAVAKPLLIYACLVDALHTHCGPAESLLGKSDDDMASACSAVQALYEGTLLPNTSLQPLLQHLECQEGKEHEVAWVGRLLGEGESLVEGAAYSQASMGGSTCSDG
ncbi:unnamed protein product [Chrysoparadoxa australica]